MVKNAAFVFIKPHANTEAARTCVKDTLQAKGLKVTNEGLITGKEIDEKQLIDNHYYAIASKATILKPDQLNVPEKMFAEKFGSSGVAATWPEALENNKVFNAKDACAYFGMDSNELNTEWAKAKKAGKLVKFGGGFYCGLIDTVAGKNPVFVMNGFFMSMRQNFVAEGAAIYYFTVEWEEKQLSWESFRGDVLGPTDPKDAPEDSLRGMFFRDWAKYGLAYEPNVGDNAVHASASPFEALSEKMNWLGVKAENDEFGQAVCSLLDRKTLTSWSRDPQVCYGVPSAKITRSCFDSLEDTDASYCLALLGMMYTQSDETIFADMTSQLREVNTEEDDAAEEHDGEIGNEVIVPGPTMAAVEALNEKKLKAIRKEGGKKGVEIEGAADMGGLQFFCTSVELPAGDLEITAESMKAMNSVSDPTEEERKGGSGKIGKMLLSMSDETLSLVCYVPSHQKDANATEWLTEICALSGAAKPEIVNWDGCPPEAWAGATLKKDSDKGVFPIKMRDPAITNAYSYLKKKGLFPDGNDDDDDEMVFGDEDFDM